MPTSAAAGARPSAWGLGVSGEVAQETTRQAAMSDTAARGSVMLRKGN